MEAMNSTLLDAMDTPDHLQREAPAGGRRRVTIGAIAAALGVSRATVSNAYNRPDQLSATLRRRVLETAARLGYAGPDPAARSLRRGQAGAIGLLYADRLSYAFADPAAVLFLDGVSEATEEAGLNLLLVAAPPRQHCDPAKVVRAVVDGFILHSMADDDPLVKAAIERGLPIVAVDQPEPAGVPFVSIDDEGGARAAAEHLVQLGHRHVGVVTFRITPDAVSGLVDRREQQAATMRVARVRLQAYKSALKAAGVAWADVPVYQCAEHTPFEGRAAAEILLARSPRPTAILATSDQLALGALEAARQRGLRVPEDVSVVGFDDIPAAAQATPGLTTVHQPHGEKGERAARLLIAQIRGEVVASPELFPTRIVIRGSSARPGT